MYFKGLALFLGSGHFCAQGLDLLGQFQPALFELLDFAVDGAQLLARFRDIGAGQAGRGQLGFQAAALVIELGQLFVDLFQLVLEGLCLVSQLLARGGGRLRLSRSRQGDLLPPPLTGGGRVGRPSLPPLPLPGGRGRLPPWL